MKRFIRRLKCLPTRNRVGAAISLAVVIGSLIGFVFQVRELVAGNPEAKPAPARAAVARGGNDFFPFSPWR